MSPAPPGLLFVDGIDGSGKSTLARNLHHSLTAQGLRVVTFAVDDHRKPLDWYGLTPQEDAYYNDYFDLVGLDAALRTDLGRQDCDLVMVEGVFSQRLRTSAGGALLYVDVPWNVARERILHRDQTKGRSLEEIIMRIDQRYFPGQRRYQREHDPLGKAHWVVSAGVKRTPRPVPLTPALEAQITTALARLWVPGAM